MTKSQLIQALGGRQRIPLTVAETIVNTIFQAMSEALVRGERIELRGFGSFTVKNYGSYTGRNPQTGERIQVRAKRPPFFKVGRVMEKRVDGK